MRPDRQGTSRSRWPVVRRRQRHPRRWKARSWCGRCYGRRTGLAVVSADPADVLAHFKRLVAAFPKTRVVKCGRCPVIEELLHGQCRPLPTISKRSEHRLWSCQSGRPATSLVRPGGASGRRVRLSTDRPGGRSRGRRTTKLHHGWTCSHARVRSFDSSQSTELAVVCRQYSEPAWLLVVVSWVTSRSSQQAGFLHQLLASRSTCSSLSSSKMYRLMPTRTRKDTGPAQARQ